MVDYCKQCGQWPTHKEGCSNQDNPLPSLRQQNKELRQQVVDLKSTNLRQAEYVKTYKSQVQQLTSERDQALDDFIGHCKTGEVMRDVGDIENELKVARVDLGILRKQVEQLTQERDNHPVCCCIIKDDKLVRRCKVHAVDAEAQAQKYKDKLTRCSVMYDEVEDSLADSCRREGIFKKALEKIADPILAISGFYERGCNIDRKNMQEIAQEALQVESKESTTYENEAMAWVVEYSDGGEQCLNCGYSEPTDPGTGHTCMAQAPTDCPAFEDLEQDIITSNPSDGTRGER